MKVAAIRSLRYIPTIALLLLLAGTAALLARPSEPSGAPKPPVLSKKVVSVPDPLPSPGKGALELRLKVPARYHIFGGEGLAVTPEPADGVTFGKPSYPKGKMEDDFEVHRGEVTITIPVTLDAGLDGDIAGALALDWQGCQDFGDKVCFLPTTTKIPFTVKAAGVARTEPAKEPQAAETPPEEPVTAEAAPETEPAAPAGAVAQQTAEAAPPSADSGAEEGSLAGRFGEAARNNVPLALLLAFLFGILSSLTPCVFPVIPITVAYIGSRSEGKGKAAGFFLSLAFVLGMAIVYAVLGAVSAKAGAALGSLAANPWVGIPIALLFFLLSLSMFGLFELRTPSFIANRLEKGKAKSQGKGFFGAFVIGAISGLVVSPCIGPLVLAILIVVAGTGSVVLGFSYLFAFALGLGVLFIVVGTFAGFLSSLPKAGPWMDGIKIAFGVLILGAAFYFAGLYLSKANFIAASLFALMAVIAFLVFGGKRHFLPIRFRIIGSVLSGMALIAATSLLPNSVFDLKGNSAGNLHAEAWVDGLEAGLAKGKAENKPILLDFRADWCVACVELEQKTWPDEQVAARLSALVPVRVDQTKNTPENRARQDRYGVMGLPTVILLDPDGSERSRFVGFKPPEKFLSWLDEQEGKP